MPTIQISATNKKVPYFQICEATNKYVTRRALTEDQILKAAKVIIGNRFKRGTSMTSVGDTREYLLSNYALVEQEIFVCLFLDNQHRLLSHEELFYGTIDSASVYPREVLKRVMELNAAAVIFAHNHPSGISEASENDKAVTLKLKGALEFVDVRVLDHFIVGADCVLSFSEEGLI